MGLAHCGCELLSIAIKQTADVLLLVSFTATCLAPGFDLGAVIDTQVRSTLLLALLIIYGCISMFA